MKSTNSRRWRTAWTGNFAAGGGIARDGCNANVEFVATKKGMAAALALAAHNKDLSAYSFDRLTKAAAMLLDRAGDVGALRAAITPEELFRAMIGICIANEGRDGRRRRSG